MRQRSSIKPQRPSWKRTPTTRQGSMRDMIIGNYRFLKKK